MPKRRCSDGDPFRDRGEVVVGLRAVGKSMLAKFQSGMEVIHDDPEFRKMVRVFNNGNGGICHQSDE